MATDFEARELCTAVGDIPAAVEASGEFTGVETEGEAGNRPGSGGVYYLDREDQGIVCPHLVQENSRDRVLSAGGKTSGVVEQVAVCKHKLDTSSTENSIHDGVEEYISETAYISPSPSPSPLQESGFEPYVICTKTRSETSCSNESQCSSSSGEYLESWSRGKQGDAGNLRSAPVPKPRSVFCNGRHLPSEQSRSFEGEGVEHIRCVSPTQTVGINDDDESGDERVTMLVSAGHESPDFLCKTKPVLPPPTDFLTDNEDLPPSPLLFPSINSPSQSTHLRPSSPLTYQPPTTPPLPQSSNSELHTSLFVQRARALTFHQCKAGEEEGRFNADYLGVKEVDMYAKSINSVAKELAMSQRPKEIQVFVTSERIRLAPPNSPTLFRSFMVKDILLVRRCSKNKRIIGMMVWKRKGGVPSCHIFRCQDDVMATSLYNAVWQQTQKVDEVAFSKSDGHVPRPPSTGAQQLSDDSSSSGHSSPATEFLQKFPAVYIGSMATPKAHSMNSIVEKVLMESKPSQAKFITISLSLLEIRFVEDRKELAGNPRESEEIFLSHDTSRIRSMGAYTQDKRFAGYVIKEEGKPMLAHVIKCNSAALMVSFTGFLRQSCQLMSHQRGGAFYEELSTDESDELEASMENFDRRNEGSGIARRFRSLTSSIPHLTSLSTVTLAGGGSTSPTFQSHMHPSSTPSTPTTKDRKSPDTSKKWHDHAHIPPGPSPHDFADDEYARFSVTYIGSATQEKSVLNQQSVESAMAMFLAEGTAGGRAAVVKNTVLLQVSSLGINLTDKTSKMFIHRNYPCKTVAGYCSHLHDPAVFAFASHRPGYPNIVKVHVFRCGSEPVEQIMDAMRYWLKVDSVTP